MSFLKPTTISSAMMFSSVCVVPIVLSVSYFVEPNFGQMYSTLGELRGSIAVSKIYDIGQTAACGEREIGAWMGACIRRCCCFSGGILYLQSGRSDGHTSSDPFV